MIILCLSCYEIYDKDLVRPYTKNGEIQCICPMKRCSGRAIEVDELIAPSIISLNKKGYETDFCCSGHHYDSRIDTYVLFSKGVYIASAPREFRIDLGLRITVRAIFESNSVRDKLAAMGRFNLALMDWAESLPSIIRSEENE